MADPNKEKDPKTKKEVNDNKWEDPEKRKNLLDRLEDFLNKQQEDPEYPAHKVPVPPENKPEEKPDEKKQSKGFLEWLWG